VGSDTETERIRLLLRKHALVNALRYGGKANPKAVAGKAFSEDPALKERGADVFRLAEEVAAEVSAMGLEEQRAAADSLGLSASVSKEKIKQEHLLPPLPNAGKYPRIHVRFAPNPDSVIHLGNTRAAILSDEYAKMYSGLFTLRYEDTSPSVKPPMPEAYEAIKDDLRWLGVRWDEEYIQSDRLELYYEYAVRLISLGGAYICSCVPERFREASIAGRACPCRGLPPEEHLKRWDAMLGGKARKGESVMRVKTDLSNPNPAVRDWPAMRIDTKPHPRKGTRYMVWPLYNFASAVDDHLMGITHILRGKEHEVNTQRQIYMYRHFGWEYPEAIHYGRLKIEGAVLSKSKIRQGIEEGLYSDWSDPRLGTIAALRRRGFLPETVRRLILEVGVRPSEAMISWENLEAINRKLLDPTTKRFVFLRDPVPLRVKGIGGEHQAKIPLHPDHPEWGHRTFTITPSGKEAGGTILVQSEDAKRPVFRLMNLFNVRVGSAGVGEVLGEDLAEARRLGAHIIQWLPGGSCTPVRVVMPDATTVEGVADPALAEEPLPGTYQFYRFGFVRVYREREGIVGYFAHQ